MIMDFNISLNDEAKDFFLYSYFGIVSEDMYNELSEDEKDNNILSYEDFVIAKCIDRAYLDLCRTLRFNSDSDGEKANGKTGFADAKKLLRNEIKKLLQNDITEDDWHATICNNLIAKVNESGILKEYLKDEDDNSVGFSFGHAQKWVNMSLKYLWLLGLVQEKLEKSLHIPIDNYIVEALWENESLWKGCGNQLIKQKGVFRTEKIKSWSQWTKTEYMTFHDNLPENIRNSLAKENAIWIKTAAKHSIK